VPFRCYACGWRDWLPDTTSPAAPPLEVHKQPADAEPDTLDLDLHGDADEPDVSRR
jgi:hypothetical protein